MNFREVPKLLAARLSRDLRYPQQSRVPYNPATVSGTMITPDTAVTISTVWACLRFLSETVAKLPFHVMKEVAEGADVQSTHPVDYLLWKRPNDEWSSFQLRETLVHWA